MVQELQDILSDAAASMEATSSSLSSAAGKAKWWRQRQAQDKRMAALLHGLDQHVLGPWRCLLMQPGQPAIEEAAASASQVFVSECFDCVLGEHRGVPGEQRTHRGALASPAGSRRKRRSHRLRDGTDYVLQHSAMCHVYRTCIYAFTIT